MPNPADIVEVAVHPALGIARVGNATDGYFLAPEIPGTAAVDTDRFRDPGPAGEAQRVKRQAVRFRIYATLRSGRKVEITADDGTIEWRVEIANLKAGWYQFNNAMDLGAIALGAKRRNAAVTGQNRRKLDIRPAEQSISGRDKAGDAFRFDDGRFHGQPVYLGELRTDTRGRLLFLGGHGVSAALDPNAKPTTFANNDGWHDDTSDGPVRATVKIGGVTFEAKPGYVVTAPTNYAPGLFGVVTMDDVIVDAYIAKGWRARPATPSFTRDIFPMFDRLAGNQWVNEGMYLLFGHGARLDLGDEATIRKLADNAPAARALRAQVLALFRPPHAARPQNAALPTFYGDTYGESDTVGDVDLSLTPTQYAMLTDWANGNFHADWHGRPRAADFDLLTPDAQVEALDRAGLTECLGGPFHPGIELTWIMRNPLVWEAPYRMALLPGGVAVRQDFGDELTPARCLAADGPLRDVGPGALTR